MDQFAPVILSLGGTLITVGGAAVIARRYGKLGGNEAQNALNKVLKDLNDGYEDRIAQLTTDFAACKSRLIAVERKEAEWRKERLSLKQELFDLRTEMKMLRARVTRVEP